MKMIVGLGNPGRQYTYTRHNAGFLFLDYLAGRLGVKVERAKCKGLYGETFIGGEKVLLVKPQTFMNLSGECVREMTEYYHIPMQDVVVVSDDISMEVGSLRIREKGSAGGHNGLKSIIYQTQTEEFPRIRIGVGAKPHPDYDLAAWVLGEFGKEEEPVLLAMFERAQTAAELLLAGKAAEAMNRCNITVKHQREES